MASKLSEYCKVLQSNILFVVKTVTTVKILCCVEYNFVWFHLVCCVFVNYFIFYDKQEYKLCGTFTYTSFFIEW